MKKGKEMKNSELDNAPGGYVLKETNTGYYNGGGCTNTAYTVIDEKGKRVSAEFADLGWAKHVAREKGQSDEVITGREHSELCGKKVV